MKPMLLLVLFLASAAHAALGPTTPPPGVTPSAWVQMTGRADWVARSIATLAPNANKECVYAVVLELLGEIEVAWSQDAKGRGPGTKRSVAKGQEGAFSDSLKRNSLDVCKGGGGGGSMVETLKGVLQFASNQSDWTQDNYKDLENELIRAAKTIVGSGIFAPAVKGTVAMPAGLQLPVLNPELFMPPERRPDEGT